MKKPPLARRFSGGRGRNPITKKQLSYGHYYFTAKQDICKYFSQKLFYPCDNRLFILLIKMTVGFRYLFDGIAYKIGNDVYVRAEVDKH